MTSTLRASGANSQVSIPSPERHWAFTKARLERTTPVIYDPAAVINGPVGTVIEVDTADALLDVQPGSVHWHNVRNVRTYGAGAESTFGTIAEGAPVYYDRSSTMPANTFLSTSPLDRLGADNRLFGYAVLGKGEVAADFPKGAGTASTVGMAVMQVGSAGPATVTVNEGTVPANNYAATAAPTVDDDTTDGYGPGSIWVNVTTDDIYVCTDGTDGAAVWVGLPPTVPTHNYAGGAAPGVTDDVTDGYGPGSIWIDTVGGDVYACVDGTDGAAVWVQLNA